MKIQKHDTKFLDELNNAPESEIPGFDKHLHDSRPGHISSFHRIDRHVKILPNYRIYLGTDIILKSGCPCQKCIASNYIKRTRIFFRIQKGKVSKQSERVASVNFEHTNFSFNYMLSRCLLKNPDKLDDINVIALQTNNIQPEKILKSCGVITNSNSKNHSVITENLFDFKDLILTIFSKEKKTELFYAIDQFGNLWFNKSEELDIWLTGIKLVEKGWIKLKVDTTIENERYTSTKYYNHMEELIPKKEVINKIELLNFSILKEFKKEKNKALILKELKKFKVKID